MSNKSFAIKIEDFSKLTDLGFSSTEIIEKGEYNPSIENKKLVFIKDKVKVEITFHHFIDGRKINLFISRTDKNKVLSFNDYLRYTGVGEEKILGTSDETDSTFVERYSILLDIAINKDLEPVLNGEKWIEIPKDYSAFR